MDALLTLFALLVGALLLVALLLTLATILGLRSLKRRNRISPDEPTEAPIVWLWSPAAAARLHRRLRSAVSVARLIAARHHGDRTSRIAELATDLEREALALDRHLSVVGRLAPTERRRVAAHLRDEVAQVERLASRLSMLDAEGAATISLAAHGSATAELARQLDLLEEARRELRQMESAAGLETTASLRAEPTRDGR